MTPKEKAEKLVDRYLNLEIKPWTHIDPYMGKYAAKQCALLTVDEISPINSNPQAIKYWLDVRREIKNL